MSKATCDPRYAKRAVEIMDVVPDGCRQVSKKLIGLMSFDEP